MTALLMLAAEAAEKESSHTAFYVAGGALTAWALVVAALGIGRPDFPANPGGRAAVIALSVILVAAATSTAVITAG
jgi:hypothetical protein